MSIVRDEDWDRLAAMDMYPFPLAIEIRYRPEGFVVELVVVTEVSDGGCGLVQLARYQRPYESTPEGRPDASPEAAQAVATEAVTHFATRLRDVLRFDEVPE